MTSSSHEPWMVENDCGHSKTSHGAVRAHSPCQRRNYANSSMHVKDPRPWSAQSHTINKSVWNCSSKWRQKVRLRPLERRMNLDITILETISVISTSTLPAHLFNCVPVYVVDTISQHSTVQQTTAFSRQGHGNLVEEYITTSTPLVDARRVSCSACVWGVVIFGSGRSRLPRFSCAPRCWFGCIGCILSSVCSSYTGVFFRPQIPTDTWRTLVSLRLLETWPVYLAWSSTRA